MGSLNGKTCDLKLSNFSAQKLNFVFKWQRQLSTKNIRKYDERFKIKLLKMVKSGRSAAEVSRTMGIG